MILSKAGAASTADDGLHWGGEERIRERAMGTENTALDPIISCNHIVMNSPERCVGLWCEKQCHTSQRQPMRSDDKYSQ